MIGALAAVGLIATRNDGRVVQHAAWPDSMTGMQDIAQLHKLGIVVREVASESIVPAGLVDVGKHLRPNLRDGQVVLYVNPEDGGGWLAVRVLDISSNWLGGPWGKSVESQHPVLAEVVSNPFHFTSWGPYECAFFSHGARTIVRGSACRGQGNGPL